MSIFIGTYSCLCLVCDYRHVDEPKHMALSILVAPTALHLHLICQTAFMQVFLGKEKDFIIGVYFCEMA